MQKHVELIVCYWSITII